MREEKTTDERRKPRDTSLRPFKSYDTNAVSIGNDIREKLLSPLSPGEIRDNGMGYIYILRSQRFSTLAELKIGFSKYHPEHRAHQLARCLYNPEIVAHTQFLPHAKRVESIIHTELTPYRKVQFCGQCQRNHQEWFTISHIDARDVVKRWSRWMLQRPYMNGTLAQPWQDYLARANVGPADDSISIDEHWTDLINKFPVDESVEPKERQIASYLNALYYEHSARFAFNALGIEDYQGDFEKLLRHMSSLGPIGANPSLDLDELFFHDDILTASNVPGPSNIETTESVSDRLKYLAEAKDLLDHMKSVKTGSMSVSDPELGVSESPLGDATLLPVISLEELASVHQSAKNWVGYDPTHAGFQLLQEAYQNWEWAGPRPQFRGPKMWRKHRSRKARRTTTNEDAESVCYSQNKAAGASVSPRQSPTSERDVREDCPSAAAPTSSTTPHPPCEVKFIPGPKGRNNKLEFSTALTPELIDAVEQQVEKIRNGGRAEVEEKLRKCLAAWGVDQCVDPDDTTSSDDELSDPSETDEDDRDDEDEDDEEMYHKPPAVGVEKSADDGKVSIERVVTVAPSSQVFSTATLGNWLNSL